MKMQFDRILVRKLPKDDITISGIKLLGKMADTLERGVIIAAGPGRRTQDGQTIPMTLKEGDKVVFVKPAQPPTIINGEEVFLMYEAEIAATQ